MKNLIKSVFVAIAMLLTLSVSGQVSPLIKFGQSQSTVLKHLKKLKLVDNKTVATDKDSYVYHTDLYEIPVTVTFMFDDDKLRKTYINLDNTICDAKHKVYSMSVRDDLKSKYGTPTIVKYMTDLLVFRYVLNNMSVEYHCGMEGSVDVHYVLYTQQQKYSLDSLQNHCKILF